MSKSNENGNNKNEIRRISCASQQKLDFILENYNNDDNTMLWIKVAKLENFVNNIHLVKNLQSLTLKELNLSAIPFRAELIPNLKRLNLSYNHFETLTEEILKLKNLESLNLSSNRISTLPENFRILSKIKNLNLSENKFCKLPKCITFLFNLESLNLSSNQITNASFMIEGSRTFNSLDETKENSSPLFISPLLDENHENLTKATFFELPQSLRSLNLSFNKLINVSPTIFKLKNLKHLNLTCCKLDHLDDSFCNLSNLKTLNISYNQIKSFPNEFAKLKNLKKVNLRMQQFAQIIEDISSLHNLVDLDLSYIDLSNTSLECLANLKKLKYLSLYLCNLNSYPEAISNISSLRYLNLSINRKIKNISKSIKNLKNLEVLIICRCKLKSLCEEISELKNLRVLQLSENKFTSIPEGVFKLNKLLALKIHRNEITYIPDKIKQMKNLITLDISSNMITEIAISADLSKNIKTNRDKTFDFEEFKKINLKCLKHEKLKFSKYEIFDINDDMGELQNLRYLYLGTNRLKNLPESIGCLTNLDILNLKNNELRSLPESIGCLTNLVILSPKCNELRSLPESIGSLKNLITLNLKYNKLRSFPELLSNLTKLEHFFLSQNDIKNFPESSLKTMINLKTLKLSGNYFKSLPENFGNLISLKKLDISFNKLKTLPKSIGNLSNIRNLDLRDNKLRNLPESFGNLTNLRYFNLSGNIIENLPNSMGSLTKINSISLSMNKLQDLPKSLQKLKNLHTFSLCYNELEFIPESILNVEGLTKLYLENNRIEKFPSFINGKFVYDHISSENIYDIKLNSFSLKNRKKICEENNVTDNDSLKSASKVQYLSNLEYINLNNNNLRIVPESIIEFKNLKGLYLGNNRIETLPRTIIAMQHLTILDLRGNPVLESGEGGTVAKIQLQEVFGDRVLFDEDIIEGPEVIISREELYKILEEEQIYWNREAMKVIKSSLAPKHNLSGHQIIKIWDESIAPKINELEAEKIRNYLLSVYEIDPEAFKGWKMHEKYFEMTKDYIEAIFDLIIHKHNSDRDVIVSNMSELSKALNFCPDRHMGELNLIYSVLSGKISTENYNFETFSVDSYIKNCVANLKEKLLESSVTPLNAKQNVHVLNYWKCKLSDELGLSFDFETNMGTFDQDKFDDEEGNALQAFYSFFTPDYVINEITSEINQNISIQRYVISEILNDEQL